MRQYHLCADAAEKHRQEPSSIPGPPGWSTIGALCNGAVVHYGASITGVNWVGSHAKPFLSVWHKLQVHLSSFPSIYFLVFYGHLVVTCRVSTSEKPPYWKSMACNLGTFTLQRTAACSQTVAIGWVWNWIIRSCVWVKLSEEQWEEEITAYSASLVSNVPGRKWRRNEVSLITFLISGLRSCTLMIMNTIFFRRGLRWITNRTLFLSQKH